MMDVRLKKIKISLPPAWISISSENTNGPPTYINGGINEPGVLQISFIEYIKGERPNPDYQDLISLSENIGLRNQFGQITNKYSGNCNFGKYGKVEFTNQDFPYISIWHLSNGRDFVLSTFICSKIPMGSELRDVEGILMSIKKKSFLF